MSELPLEINFEYTCNLSSDSKYQPLFTIDVFDITCSTSIQLPFDEFTVSLTVDSKTSIPYKIKKIEGVDWLCIANNTISKCEEASAIITKELAGCESTLVLPMKASISPASKNILKALFCFQSDCIFKVIF